MVDTTRSLAMLVEAFLRLECPVAVRTWTTLTGAVTSATLWIAASHAKTQRAAYRTMNRVQCSAVVEALASGAVLIVLFRLKELLNRLYGVKVPVLMPHDE